VRSELMRWGLLGVWRDARAQREPERGRRSALAAPVSQEPRIPEPRVRAASDVASDAEQPVLAGELR